MILGGRNLGTVRLGLSREKMDAQIDRQRRTSLLITLVVLGMGVIVALWFARSVTYRLNRLRQSAEAMIEGDLDVQAGLVLEKNCWEIMDCQMDQCPAYGDSQRRCWRLAGGVAHEINTPLGIILGYTQLLVEEIEDQSRIDDLKIIERQTRVCRKIVADLLGFSRYSGSATFAGIHDHCHKRSPAPIVISRFENRNCFFRVLNPPGLLFSNFPIQPLTGSAPTNFMYHYLLSML